MTEDKIKEYLNNGGKLFSVKNMDTCRDGGTMIIQTMYMDYYMDHKNKTLHTEYPPTDENIITDNQLIEFIIYKIDLFLTREEVTIMWYKKTLTEIKNRYNY